MAREKTILNTIDPGRRHGGRRQPGDHRPGPEAVAATPPVGSKADDGRQMVAEPRDREQPQGQPGSHGSA